MIVRPNHTPPTAGTSGLVTALRPRQLVAGLGVLSLAAVLAFAGPAGAAELDPAGNNGTVKIDGIAFDDHQDNEPHPGCIFEVDFYGFDEGAVLNATVTFAAIAPTGKDEILEVDDDIVFIVRTPTTAAAPRPASTLPRSTTSTRSSPTAATKRVCRATTSS